MTFMFAGHDTTASGMRVSSILIFEDYNIYFHFK